MKSYLILILTVLALAALAACSGDDSGVKEAGHEAEVVDQSEKTSDQTAEKTAEMVPEAGVQDSVEKNLEASRAAIAALGGGLKSALQEAMKQGGPVAAVNVCHDEAEVIARQICDEKGLTVGRTSRKFRSPDNAPDGWEQAGLEAFAARISAGEKPQDLEMWATVTDADGGRVFRYLKAIPTAPQCLKCHGGELAPDLAEKMAELYPGDKARGYAAGDMRGAFTVKVELPRS
jgi:hypothetical protein